MNNLEPQTPTPVWKTIMWPAAALAITQTTYLLVMKSELVWYLLPLIFVGPFLIPLVALIATMWRSAPAPPRYALLVLPVVLYTTGIVSCVFVWWVDGSNPDKFPLSSDMWTASNSYKTFGVHGIPAGILWVGCLLHTWRYTRTAHRTKTRTEG